MSKFVLEYEDGRFEKQNELDVKNPDQALMEGIVAVYEIKTEYEPKLILAPKPKAERDEIVKKKASEKAED